MTTENNQRTSGSAWGKWREAADSLGQSCRGTLRDAEARIRKELRHAVPPEARKHFGTSKREFLIGLRELIDGQIKKQPPRS